MLAFVIAQRSERTGQRTAVLCDPGPLGHPDRRSAVPVQIELINERVLSVDGENREIISCMGLNGTSTYLINGSTKGLRNRERRVALAKASALAQQLRSCLLPLLATSEEYGAAEGLQLLFDWIADERELATAPQRSAEGGRDAR